MRDMIEETCVSTVSDLGLVPGEKVDCIAPDGKHKAYKVCDHGASLIDGWITLHLDAPGDYYDGAIRFAPRAELSRVEGLLTWKERG